MIFRQGRFCVSWPTQLRVGDLRKIRIVLEKPGLEPKLEFCNSVYSYTRIKLYCT